VCQRSIGDFVKRAPKGQIHKKKKKNLNFIGERASNSLSDSDSNEGSVELRVIFQKEKDSKKKKKPF